MLKSTQLIPSVSLAVPLSGWPKTQLVMFYFQKRITQLEKMMRKSSILGKSSNENLKNKTQDQ